MKKIILKISLLLIASSFSVQLYPAASAAKTPDELQALVKQHTKQKLTPAQRAEEYAKLSSEERTALGGGAAPAEKSFSSEHENPIYMLQPTIDAIDASKRLIKEIEKSLKEGPEDLKEMAKTHMDMFKKNLKLSIESLIEIYTKIGKPNEAERIARENSGNE